MAQKVKRASTKPLKTPNRSIAVGIILTMFILLVSAVCFSIYRTATTSSPSIATLTPTASPSPTPIFAQPISVDTSAWKTYTDWRYGFSIELPPQYYPVAPGKGYTEPQGNGEMDFEDGLYRDPNNPTNINPNNPYGFTVRITKGNHLQNDCTTDEECLAIQYDFFKNLPNTRAYLLQTKILNRDVKGLAIIDAPSSRVSNVYYEFTNDGKPYELTVSDVGTFDNLRAKLPYINIVASTISLN